MPIVRIERTKPLQYKLVYGVADGMPKFLKPTVVCGGYVVDLF